MSFARAMSQHTGNLTLPAFECAAKRTNVTETKSLAYGRNRQPLRMKQFHRYARARSIA